MHFFKSCIHERQITQWIRTTLEHNNPHLCRRIIYSKECPILGGHYKLERSQSAYWCCHLKPCVHYIFVKSFFYDLDKPNDYVYFIMNFTNIWVWTLNCIGQNLISNWGSTPPQNINVLISNFLGYAISMLFYVFHTYYIILLLWAM